eukprot:m.17465 g.17465  ORF g.17465 m.17465 type:complete len:310 (-) comp3502_c0_seq2:194-1123(-)
MWTTVRHAFGATSPEELSLEQGEPVFVLQEMAGKQWCLVANLKYEAGWAPVNHLGATRVAEVTMLESLDVAMRKHVQGKISAEELVSIKAVYELASAKRSADEHSADTERQRFLTTLEQAVAQSAASAGVLSAVRAAMAGEGTGGGLEGGVDEGYTTAAERALAHDLLAAGSAADPFAKQLRSRSDSAGAGAATTAMAGRQSTEGPTTPPPATPTVAPDSPQTQPVQHDNRASASPGRKRGGLRKTATVWTWSEAISWMVRTYELPEEECEARLCELVRFGFSESDAAEALVKAAGDVDKATVLLVAKS